MDISILLSLEAPWVKPRMAQFCEYTLLGTPAPHSPQLRSPSTNYTSLSFWRTCQNRESSTERHENHRADGAISRIRNTSSPTTIPLAFKSRFPPVCSFQYLDVGCTYHRCSLNALKSLEGFHDGQNSVRRFVGASVKKFLRASMRHASLLGCR